MPVEVRSSEGLGRILYRAPGQPDKQDLGWGELTILQLLLVGCTEAKPFQQPDGPLVLRFNRGEKAAHPVSERNMLQYGLSCLRGKAPTQCLLENTKPTQAA